jgi:tRNA-dihydrouridine synthase A
MAPRAVLYTEMVTTGALLRGDLARHLRFHPAERPVALQLGGSEPEELARCARLAQGWGYDEINLNCGCPSERVQRGAFGACLMAEPALVADCVKAMQDAVSVPVTVKHRLGVDRIDEYDFVRRFVEALALAGCGTFIVHARNAVLRGLSPKDNREIPPLRYADVYRLKRDFPEATIVINGAIRSIADARRHLLQVDGVMLGRTAYHDPWRLAQLHAELFGGTIAERERVAVTMTAYAREEVSRGEPLRAIVRHMLGLFHGEPEARRWRRMLSDPQALARNDPALILHALEAVSPLTVGA